MSHVAEENSDSRCTQQTGVPPRPWYAERHSPRHHSPIQYSPHSTTVLLPRVRIRVTIRSLDTLYQEESSNPNVKQAPLRPSCPRTLFNRACTHSVYRTLRSPVSDDGPLRHCQSSSSWTPSSARWLDTLNRARFGPPPPLGGWCVAWRPGTLESERCRRRAELDSSSSDR